jgi:AraC-like DNA-binding protein
MAKTQPVNVKTISEYHKVMGLHKPHHPLISVIKFEDIKRLPEGGQLNLVINFYSIGLKKGFNAKMKYGQQEYDFDVGIMTFMSPGQVLRIEVKNEEELNHSGWLLLVHPDFLYGTTLLKTIKGYEYFDYAIAEALHLSDKEETVVAGIMQDIEQEYQSNIDQFSQSVIIAQMELLLTYAERFYNRQFITRKIASHKILHRLEDYLSAYFSGTHLSEKGLPSVQSVATALHVSPNYLSSLLKALTGQNTQQHIHNKLIEKAKEKLSTTGLSVSEIAYDLGFEHPQSFSKLFKTKTDLSPLRFRQTFN